MSDDSPRSLTPSPSGSSSVVSPSGSSSTLSEVARIVVCGGGAVALTVTGCVPPIYGLVALVAIALPTHAGKLIDWLRNHH